MAVRPWPPSIVAEGGRTRRGRVERHLPARVVDRSALADGRAGDGGQAVAPVDRGGCGRERRGRVERHLAAGAINGGALAFRRTRRCREALARGDQRGDRGAQRARVEGHLPGAVDARALVRGRAREADTVVDRATHGAARRARVERHLASVEVKRGALAFRRAGNRSQAARWLDGRARGRRPRGRGAGGERRQQQRRRCPRAQARTHDQLLPSESSSQPARARQVQG